VGALNDMKRIPENTVHLIQEIDELWEPVYPFLAKHIVELYGRKDGVILEIGPFCGAIYSLLLQGVGSQFVMAAFPPEMVSFFGKQIHEKGHGEKICVVETDQSLSGIKRDSIDLIVFRGALFFPSLFQVEYGAINRVIKKGGIAMIGGGFGKLTPPEIIRPIAEQSKELNLKIGKVEVAADQIREDIKASGILADFWIVQDGGLWVILNKG